MPARPHAGLAITLRAALAFSAAAGCASQPSPAATAAGASGRTLVAVFAHPDDETIVSPLLAHYARRGARVHLVVATDGRLGTTSHARIPAGDSLATVRAGEARCAAQALGAASAVLVGLPDAGLAVLSPWPGEPMHRLAGILDTVLARLRPDAVVTWGPEGGYGHQDHRLTGDVVTQLFQAGRVPGARLYFPGFPAVRTTTAPRWFGQVIYPTAEEHLRTIVDVDAEDLAAARRALSCHRSQATAGQMDTTWSAVEHLWQGRVMLQRWQGGPRTTSVF